MLENIWRYNYIGFGGIVIASTREEAKQKVKEMYKDWVVELEKENVVTVWQSILDDNYSTDYPDILEIY